MKNAPSFLCRALLAVAFMVSGALPAFSQRAVLVSANVAQVGKGYPTSMLHGRTVRNDRNESIGTLAELVLGRDYALFAILDIGGFLGIHGRLVAVPIRTLVLDDSGRRIMLPGATRKALRNFPEFKFPS
jgi:hypothetical protein